jgi:nucleoside-diphosphate-sugar epimerase
VDYRRPATLLDTPALEGARYLYHVAGQTRARSSGEFRDANVLPVRGLLEAVVRRRTPLERFLLVSSQAAAGPARGPSHIRTEEEPPEPVEEYGRSKLEAEELLRSLDGQVPWTIVRPGVVFGPHDAAFLNIFRLTRFRLNLYPGYKHRSVCWIYVEDLVEGMINAAASPATPGRTYFLASERPATWQEIHETIFRLCGRRVNLPSGLLLALARGLTPVLRPLTRGTPLLRPQGLRLSLPDSWVASSQAAWRDFGFRPRRTLEEGLRLTLDWYRRHDML